MPVKAAGCICTRLCLCGPLNVYTKLKAHYNTFGGFKKGVIVPFIPGLIKSIYQFCHFTSLLILVLEIKTKANKKKNTPSVAPNSYYRLFVVFWRRFGVEGDEGV